MRLSLCPWIFALSFFQVWGQDRSETIIAIVNVTVIDVTGAPNTGGLTVLLAGNRITAVSEGLEIPADAVVVDGRGKYLIPGLWDMHVHYPGPDLLSLNLFIANGVTGFRDMASELEMILSVRAKSREINGPRIVAAGPMFDGFLSLDKNLKINDPETARQEVRRLKEAGVDFLKVYNFLSPDVYRAIVEEAKILGLPVTGHVPFSIKMEEAVKSGQKTIEHLDEMKLIELCAEPKKREALFALFREYRTWHTPTLTANRAVSRYHEAKEHPDPMRQYATRSMRAAWEHLEAFSFKHLKPEGAASIGEKGIKARELIAAMQREGVGILAGTDLIVPFILPGFGLHDELELLVTAGLTPIEALRTATLNPALYLGRDDLGVVAPGKLADLVLLNADPTADIQNSRKIEAVFIDGHYYDRAGLDALLLKVTQEAD